MPICLCCFLSNEIQYFLFIELITIALYYFLLWNIVKWQREMTKWNEGYTLVSCRKYMRCKQISWKSQTYSEFYLICVGRRHSHISRILLRDFVRKTVYLPEKQRMSNNEAHIIVKIISAVIIIITTQQHHRKIII